jgi:hypothetical protein
MFLSSFHICIDLCTLLAITLPDKRVDQFYHLVLVVGIGQDRGCLGRILIKFQYFKDLFSHKKWQIFKLTLNENLYNLPIDH